MVLSLPVPKKPGETTTKYQNVLGITDAVQAVPLQEGDASLQHPLYKGMFPYYAYGFVKICF